MKSEKIFDGITYIKDEIVEEAGKYKFHRRKKLLTGAAAAVLVIVLGLSALLPGGTTTAYAISEAKYPSSALSTTPPSYSIEFLSDSAQAFLTNTGEENPIYSPISVYLALGMTAELAQGDSRQQILDVLDESDVHAVRGQAKEFWKSIYRDDGASTAILGSSLWLNEKIDYKKGTLDTLADDYYASSYQGDMGDPAYTQAYQDWLNRQTGGLLSDAVSQKSLNKETVLSLVTTVFYQSRWAFPFNEENTAPGVFHTPDGDVTVDFMHRSGADTYYWGDQFGAVCIQMKDLSNMWLLLPDEGVTPEELMTDPQVMEFLLSKGGYYSKEWENKKMLTVNLAVPKFDVSSELDLKDGLEKLGVTDIFDQSAADFSPMAKSPEDVYLDSISHAARVAIDEEGCVAVALTDETWYGAMMPPEDTVDFILDRPFVFAITSKDDLPLFIGIVNDP